MDRLEVELAREHEVFVLELRVALQRRLQGDPDRVLDKTGLEVSMLDNEQLVRPLQQLVDRRAHRPFDDASQLLGIHRMVAADVERSATALVMCREWNELEDPP